MENVDAFGRMTLQSDSQNSESYSATDQGFSHHHTDCHEKLLLQKTQELLNSGTEQSKKKQESIEKIWSESCPPNEATGAFTTSPIKSKGEIEGPISQRAFFTAQHNDDLILVKSFHNTEESGMTTNVSDETWLDSTAALLAETNKLLYPKNSFNVNNVKRMKSKNSDPETTSRILAETAVFVDDSTINDEQGRLHEDSISVDVEFELQRVVESTPKDLILICCGKYVNLQDIFLLNSCTLIPLREDVSNEIALATCSKTLVHHGFDVRSNEKGQLRASVGLSPLQAQSTFSQPTEQDIQIGPTTGSSSSKLTPSNSEKLKFRDDSIVSNAMSFSLDKLNAAINAVNLTFNISPSRKTSTDANWDSIDNIMRDLNYCNAVVGVDSKSKKRLIVLSGLEESSDSIIRRLIGCGLTTIHAPILTSMPDQKMQNPSLNDDYLRDIQNAFHKVMDMRLANDIAIAENFARISERKTTKIISLLKHSYKHYGISFPKLESILRLEQIPLEYDAEVKDNGSASATGKYDPLVENHKQNADSGSIELLIKGLTKKWDREFRAQKLRKLKQLELKCLTSARNRHLVLEHLRESIPTNTSKESAMLAAEMKISPPIILCCVPAIHKRIPGKLYMTFSHVLFYSNILGMKKRMGLHFEQISNFRKGTVNGAVSFMGGGSFIAVAKNQDTPKEISFIVSTELDVDSLLLLSSEIVSMKDRDHELAKHSQDSHRDILDVGSSVNSDNKLIQDERRKAIRARNAKNLMASTLLQEDEEEF